MTVGVIAVVLGWPPTTTYSNCWRSVTIAGVWEFIDNIRFTKYDVFMYGDKVVMIGNISPYRAGRTVRFSAITGDSGAAVVEKSDRSDNDYFDNRALLIQGIENYLMFN
ncbi:MAG: hypothetical protein ACLKAK_13220 [Alkaliphilus sp.]